jgi:hypothetical protein
VANSIIGVLEQVADRVIEDVKVSATLPSDNSYTPAMLQYFYYLVPGMRHRVEPLYGYTFSVRDDPVRKEIVEALILSGADFNEVSDVFDVPVEVMKVYKELFMDTDRLVSKLDIIGYLENYPHANGKALKIRAYNLGPEFIYFKYANRVPSSPVQKDMVKKLFLSSSYKAMEANYSDVGSANAKAATQHATIMLKAYEAIQKLMDDATEEGRDQLLRIVVGDNDQKMIPQISSGKII